MFSSANNFLNSIKNEYSTDIEKLTCTCLDWQEKRCQYAMDDPRRLCKHIVKKLDLNSLLKAVKYFRESIVYYQSNNKGFNDFDFDKIIHLPQNDLKILGYENLFHGIWMNVYDKEGNRYGFLIDRYTFAFIWAKEKKPIGYEEVEEYFSQPYMKLPLRLQEYEKNELIQYIKMMIPGKETSHFSIEEDQDIPSPSGIYYSAGEQNDNVRNIIDHQIRGIVVKNDEMIIEVYGGKEYSIARDCERLKLIEENIKINKEKERILKEENEKRQQQEWEEYIANQKVKAEQKEYLYDVKDTPCKETTKNMQNEEAYEYYLKYYDSYDKILSHYSGTKKLLEVTNSKITVAQFHKVLKSLNMITKVDNLNLNDWILLNDGLSYGINMAKDFSKYFSHEVPDWYEVKIIDPRLLELVNETDKKNVRMTKIIWENDRFPELLQLVIQHIENSSNASKIIVKSSLQAERDEWLQFVECPHCASKNLHKKSKRIYQYGEVQRYQCMDCKKIFQELINKKSNDDVME